MTPPRRAWLPDALIISGLLLLPLLFWWRLWVPGAADRAAIPEGDFTSQYYPLQLFAARELAAGQLPSWDPYINAGQPGLADIQTGAFYPLNLLPNLILALLGRPLTPGLLQAQVVLHFALASLFTYLLGRRLARRAGARLPAARFAGAVAALSFTYGGYLTSFPVQQLTILETAVWLPLVLLFQDLSLDSPASGVRRLGPPVLAGMALAMALLAGHPQTAMLVVYAALTYALFLFLGHARTVSHAPSGLSTSPPAHSRLVHCALRILRFALRLVPYALPFAVALALAAVQLVPTLTFIAHSTRAGLGYDAVAKGFSLSEVTHLLYPGYFGGSPQYLGILGPILALAAWFLKRARREVLFWTLLGAVAFLLSFGGDLFFYNVAYLVAPGFSAVRNQERTVFLFSFAASVLAGYGALLLVQPLPAGLRPALRRFCRTLAWVLVVFLGLTALWYFGFEQALQQGAEINLFEAVLRHHTLILFILGGSTLLFLLRLSGRVRRRWLVLLALVLIWLNLFTVNWRYNLSSPVAGGSFPSGGLVGYLKSQPGTFRISSAGLLPGGSNAGIVHEMEDITANTPLRLAAFQRLEDRLGSWRLWQLLNVEFVLTRDTLDGPGFQPAFEEGDVKVYRLSDPLPRAWVVHEVAAAGDAQAIDRLGDESFDPRRVAIVAGGLPDPLPAAQGAPAAEARVESARPGRLALLVSTGAEGLLVISQPYYPGWQARLNGERVPLLRVDSFLQGVRVPAGRYQVELSYRLPLWPALITSLALLTCIVTLVARRRRV
ncbi:MAG TPA: YfhO family protein [Anaerolineae bacterium]|nr:YfhO family protein [Anaerolineae bacterium]